MAVNTFFLTNFRDPVKVSLAPSISQQQLEAWPAFKVWQTTLQSNLDAQHKDPQHTFNEDPYVLRAIDIQSVDWFGPNEIGCVKLMASITNSSGRSLPGLCSIRGGSVAVLIILRPDDSRDERWVVLTEQARVAAGSMRFLEIPAGIIDDSQIFGGAAAREIEAQAGFEIPASELIDLTELALQRSTAWEPSIQNAMYPSPGGSDEFMAIFLWEKELDRLEIEDLRGKLTGERRQGEMITLHVVSYEDVWREGARDAKTLASWALYEGLNREGAIKQAQKLRKAPLSAAEEDELDDIEDELDVVGGAEDDERNEVAKRYRLE